LGYSLQWQDSARDVAGVIERLGSGHGCGRHAAVIAVGFAVPDPAPSSLSLHGDHSDHIEALHPEVRRDTIVSAL